MNQQAEMRLAVRGAAQRPGPHGPSKIGLRSVFWGAVLVSCAVAVVALLLVTESRLSSGERQQVFESLGQYP